MIWSNPAMNKIFSIGLLSLRLNMATPPDLIQDRTRVPSQATASTRYGIPGGCIDRPAQSLWPSYSARPTTIFRPYA